MKFIKSMAKKEGTIKVCNACKLEFYVPNYRKDTAKFCSKECLNHTQYIKKENTCQSCKETFTVSNSRASKKFCSLDCKNKTLTNEKDRRKYSKALSVLKMGKNSSRNLKKLISRVKELSCEFCGYKKRSYNLDIHHIDEDPTNNKLENLSILCAICHRDYHRGNLVYINNKYNGKEEE